MKDRFHECGSWAAECASSVPVLGCVCARCARHESAAKDATLAALRDWVERRVDGEISESAMREYEAIVREGAPK